jgi:hypothetical protein
VRYSVPKAANFLVFGIALSGMRSFTGARSARSRALGARAPSEGDEISG